MRIKDLELGVVSRALIGLNGSFKLTHLRQLRIDLLLGDDTFFVEQLVALVIHLNVAELRLIFGELPFSLFELHLIRARIDFGKILALANELPFLEINFDNLPVDARSDRHGVEAVDRTQAIQINGELAALGGGDYYRNGEATGSALPPLSLTSGTRSCGTLRLDASFGTTEVPNT